MAYRAACPRLKIEGQKSFTLPSSKFRQSSGGGEDVGSGGGSGDDGGEDVDEEGDDGESFTSSAAFAVSPTTRSSSVTTM